MTRNDNRPKELTDMGRKTVFISYSWSDGNPYADELETQLKDDFIVKRDKSQLIANDDIDDFMAEIINCDNVVIVLTAEYVKSKNCMYEMAYLSEQVDWASKSMVLVIDESLYSLERKFEVLNHWSLRQKNINQQLKDAKIGAAILSEEAKHINLICDKVESFLEKVSRRKNPSQIAVVNEIRKLSQRDVTVEKQAVSNYEKLVCEILAKNGHKTIGEISEQTGKSMATTSRILHNLSEKGVVVKVGTGRHYYYELNEKR